MTGALIVVVITISVMLIKRLEKKDASFSLFLEELTKTLKAQNDCFIAHNERATANHNAIMASFKQFQERVQAEHERMLQHDTNVHMALAVQDKSISNFDKDVAEIKCTLRNIEKLSQ